MDLSSHILVVDDDPELRTLIGDFLRDHGYHVEVAADVAGMRDAIARRRPDLVVLDVMMPGEDGLSAARRLANEGGPPVIMLSALGTDTDRIIGLEVGADDYLAKPCNPRELLARVRALLRRNPPAADGEHAPSGGLQYRFDGWSLDVARRELRDPTGMHITLSDGEFTLLRTFVEHPQRVLSRDQLLDYARGHNVDVYDRAIDSQVSRLRRKLSERGGPDMIRTIRNEGYMLLPSVVRR
ncbi:response regulator [Pseudoxanthomonas sp. LjRoot125]|uniref:response regulator n=1 Tax=Pseudoxanthomonas sp. LjRoot125 TaxID=3342258 RepID=UPI003EBD7559